MARPGTSAERVILLVALAACGGAQRGSGAIDGVLLAFDRHAIVAVAEPHHNVETHAFLRALVRDPRFVFRGVDFSEAIDEAAGR